MICAPNIGLDWYIERWSKDRIDFPLAVDLPFPPTLHISVATAMRREGSRSAENLAKFVEVELPHVPEWASVLDQNQTQILDRVHVVEPLGFDASPLLLTLIDRGSEQPVEVTRRRWGPSAELGD